MTSFKKQAVSLLMSFAIMSMLFVTNVQASQDTVLDSRDSFLWGICAHTNAYCPVYSTTNMEEQIHLAAEMGCKVYRVDFSNNFSYTDKIIKLCEAYNMKVMLIVYGALRSSFDDYNYQSDFQLYNVIAKRYNGKSGYGKVDYIQINNEVDVYLSTLTSKFGSGISIDEYPESDLKRVTEHFKNAISGIRAADSDVKIVINCGWTHFGMFSYFKENNLDYDIIGWDWYGDMSKSYKQRGKRAFQVAEELHSMFEKPIIICETNRWGSQPIDEKQETHWDELVEIVNDAYTYPYVLGCIVYELCDETNKESGDAYNREAHFGMIYADLNGNMGQPKPIYYRLKKIFGGRNFNKILLSDLVKDDQNNQASNSSSVDVSTVAPTIQNDLNSHNTDNSMYSSIQSYSGDESQTSAESVSGDCASEIKPKQKLSVPIKKTSEKSDWSVQNTWTIIISIVTLLILVALCIFICLKRKKIRYLIKSTNGFSS